MGAVVVVQAQPQARRLDELLGFDEDARGLLVAGPSGAIDLVLTRRPKPFAEVDAPFEDHEVTGTAQRDVGAGRVAAQVGQLRYLGEAQVREHGLGADVVVLAVVRDRHFLGERQVVGQLRTSVVRVSGLRGGHDLSRHPVVGRDGQRGVDAHAAHRQGEKH